MAETCIKKLEAEVEQLNRLVRRREEDTRSTKMMLRIREDKIQRMESILAGSLTHDSYLREENRALCEEIQLLQAKVDKNPEVTRFALENIRLLDQLRRFQEFYEEGEREILLDEVSKLREQLMQYLDGKSLPHYHPNVNGEIQEAVRFGGEDSSLQLELKNTVNELENCRRNLNFCLEENQKLSLEINDLRLMLDNLNSIQDEDSMVNTIKDYLDASASKLGIAGGVQNVVECKHDDTSTMKHAEVLELQLELDILKIILKEERSSHNEAEERTASLSTELELAKERLEVLGKQCEDACSELSETKLVVEALVSEQILAVHELEDLRKSNSIYVDRLSEKELEIKALTEKLSEKKFLDYPSNQSKGGDSNLQTKLKKMQDALEKAKRLNKWYQNDRSFQTNNEEEMDAIRRQAEGETAEVIVCMQEELAILQQQVHDFHSQDMVAKRAILLLETEMKELQEKLHLLNQDNEQLHAKVKGKEMELKTVSDEWELLGCQLAEILADGQDALVDASDQLDLISSTFPQKRILISEQVERLIRVISEKELLIEELGNCLEDANNKRNDVECMLKSLRGAALVINEAHQQECNEKEKEIIQLKSLLEAKTSTIEELKDKVKVAELYARKASVCATAAFVIVDRLSEVNQKKDAHLSAQAAAIKGAEEESQFLRMELVDLKKTCSELQHQFLVEEKHVNYMEETALDENDSLETRVKLTELPTGVSSLRSCKSIPLTHVGSPKTDKTEAARMPLANSNERTDAGEALSSDVPECALELRSCSCNILCNKPNGLKRDSKNTGDTDITIIHLRKELESSLQSLREVQVEMAKLRSEKEEILLSEKQDQESLRCFMTHILALQAAMGNFEKQFEQKIDIVNRKLQTFEQILLEAGTSWLHSKEFLEVEVGDALTVAAQHAAEASCIFSKFEEAQDTLKEADIMINELMIANETMKLDMKKLKNTEVVLINDRDMLLDKVNSLQCCNSLKDAQVEDLEKQLSLSWVETGNLVTELEDSISHIQTTLKENYISVVRDFHSIKTLVLDSKKLVRSWLEDVWSEIIVKDCAVSVLHLCHLGILLEMLTGLNAENGLLEHGLCESNAIIADLRERNSKSYRELHMCRSLKGKLLADIRSSFDRTLRKEEETGDLSTKIWTFEKKIIDMQLQEEMMLQRSNYIGSQLSILMKDLDLNNRSIESLLYQEKLREENEELINSKAELLMVELCSKDIESFIWLSQLEEMSIEKDAAERKLIKCGSALDLLTEQMILLMVDGELKEEVRLTKDAEIALLQTEIADAQKEAQSLLSKVTGMNEVNTGLEMEIHLLKDVAYSNDALKSEMDEVKETKVRLLNQVQALEIEGEKLQKDLQAKETALEGAFNRISALDQQNRKFEKEIHLLESSSSRLQTEVENKDVALSRMSGLEEENSSLKGEILKLKTENSLVVKDLEKRSSEIESSLCHSGTSDIEIKRLQDRILSLETVVAGLESDLDVKNAEVNRLLQSQSVLMANLTSTSQDLQIFVDKVKIFKNENVGLRNELIRSGLNTKQCAISVKNFSITGLKLFDVLEEESSMTEKMFQELCEVIERTSEFINEIDFLEGHCNDLVSENENLQAELLRKDEILKGLLFDLSLLQESASSTKDQRDKIEEMMASLDVLQDELFVKSSELDEAFVHSQMLDTQLQEKIGIISALEMDFEKERKSLEMSTYENRELKTQIKEALAAKCYLEEELAERMNLTESLETELSQMGNALSQLNRTVESLRNDLDELSAERDQLQAEIHNLKEKLEKTQALAEENEAIALEAQQIAESKTTYAEQKEVEVKLLETSVEELECTVNVLENKVDILKEEADRQRLQREDIEDELHTLNHQMQNVRSADTDMKRHLDEKEKSLQEVLKQLRVLEGEIVEKDAEIAQCKKHISELNLHAEAQASEYKQKFKSLEAMAEQVKPDGHLTHAANSSSNKLDKNAARSRGSGSPFKCIGLGLAQQIKSERDEELTAARLRIEELEAQAVCRQKEVFALNARLAAAESMTHDVIRDLLGVKLDMTNYVSLLDKQQLQKITEKAQHNNSTEPPPKEQQEIMKLKMQLNGFVEERRGWLEEIDRKQAEMVAAQIALENLRQRDQLLKTENEMLKMENVNNKKRAMELEAEVKKLSGQQNIQQRIHHHAKIKEENNNLKIQNEDLSAKLKRSEIILSRVKEELAHYRASVGKSSYVNFDEEQQLMSKLKETEDDRVQIAQKLLGLCTGVLKAAGITKPAGSLNPEVAEEALQQMKDRITSLERECQDLMYKNKITNERIRLSELMPQASPPRNSRVDENRQTPRRSQASFLSTLDR